MNFVLGFRVVENYRRLHQIRAGVDYVHEWRARTLINLTAPMIVVVGVIACTVVLGEMIENSLDSFGILTL